MPEHDIRIRDCEDEVRRTFRAQAVRAGMTSGRWIAVQTALVEYIMRDGCPSDKDALAEIIEQTRSEEQAT